MRDPMRALSEARAIALASPTGVEQNREERAAFVEGEAAKLLALVDGDPDRTTYILAQLNEYRADPDVWNDDLIGEWQLCVLANLNGGFPDKPEIAWQE